MGASNTSVVLFSGGIDSTLMLQDELEKADVDAVVALTIDYGQRNFDEIEHARDIVDYFNHRNKLTHHVIKLTQEFSIFGAQSPLMAASAEDLDRTPYEEIKERKHPAEPVSSYVPYRNGVFVSIATTIALRVGASRVLIGITGEGARDYPDCSSHFVVSQRAAVRSGTGGLVQLITPFADMSKIDIVRKAAIARIPIDLTRSCYDNTLDACGTCLACQERLAAFRSIGMNDPIKYAREAAKR